MGKLHPLQALWGFVEVSRRVTKAPGDEVKNWSMAGRHIDLSSWCSREKGQETADAVGEVKPAKPAAPSPAAVSKAHAPTQTKAAPVKEPKQPKHTAAAPVMEPQQPGLGDIAQTVAQARLKLEEAATLHAARIAEIAKEEENATAAVTTAAKQEEISHLHMQLSWEQNYLNSITESGQAADRRRPEHQENIRWCQHRITDLKAPAERAKSLTRGVANAEKALTKAGDTRDAALAARDAAEAAFQLALDAVVKAASDFSYVKEQLEGAEQELAALESTKQIVPLAEGMASVI